MGLHASSFTGQVLYNDMDISGINMYTVRNNCIGVSEQEPTLLPDTLRYNLDLDKEGLTAAQSENVNKLVDILGLSECLRRLSYEAVISESATNISGGEKQKISILRVLLKNPDVLVLDEPTSALDNSSCKALNAYLQEIKHNKIIIVVTHHNDFAQSSDHIVLL